MKTIPWIIIIILLCIIFLQRECTPTIDDPEQTINNNIDTIIDTIKGDSIPYPVNVYVPKISYRDTGSTKWLFHDVDTAKILSEFFKKHFYSDTLINDSNLFIAVYDTVTQNKIISRKPLINYYPTIITNTINLTKKPVPKLFAGIGVGRSPDQFGLSPNLLYISKKDNAYSIAYDVLNKDVYFTMYWKIKFK